MKYEIPYEQLQLIGISPRSLEMMPMDVKSKLENGDMTPIISVVHRTPNGQTAEFFMKLRMETNEQGKEGLVCYPLNAEMKNSMNLNVAAYHRLIEGDVLHVNGQYLQRDPETNCVIKKDEKSLDMDRRIAELEKVKDIELGMEQKNQLKEGKPVELDVGGEKVSVGLDLRDKDHFKTLNGDLDNWKRQKEIEYDILHPEYVGIVQTDENRWEFQKIKEEGLGTQTLKSRPMQAQSSGMKM